MPDWPFASQEQWVEALDQALTYPTPQEIEARRKAFIDELAAAPEGRAFPQIIERLRKEGLRA